MEGETVRPSTRFKGVVQKPNGNWGAQIYSYSQRIWLGTFRTELEAAFAYDSASLKLRWGGPHRNFPWRPITTEEAKFQTQYSTEEILKMIREGSYISKFLEYARSCSTGHGVEVVAWRELFRKELTASDVGPLNRMVIPKRYATEYLPNIQASGGTLELVLRDVAMRLWNFRYCYWGSSGSYVLTKGWNKFVKEKGLKEKDVVVFLECDCRMTRMPGMRRLCIIHVEKSRGNGGWGGGGNSSSNGGGSSSNGGGSSSSAGGIGSGGSSSNATVNVDDQEDGVEVDLELRLGLKTSDEEKSMEVEPLLHGAALADFKLFCKQIF
ncbi:hypothetical protein SLA2020_036270 [Shorea laevis]